MTEKEERAFRKKIAGLATEMVVMRQRLFAAGLYRTAQLMDKATTEVGWEINASLCGVDVREMSTAQRRKYYRGLYPG